ncbi:MAG: CRISPR-associated protein Csx15 [Aggregatilineales bacterium]
MIILNFSHPLTEAQIEQVIHLTGEVPRTIRAVKTQFDLSQDLSPQVVALVDGLDINAEAWQETPWLIVLPSLNFAAAVLLAELHGRIGHFPAILRLRPLQGALVTSFEVAEVINLEAVRAQARQRR